MGVGGRGVGLAGTHASDGGGGARGDARVGGRGTGLVGTKEGGMGTGMGKGCARTSLGSEES